MTFISNLINGISLGSVYAIIALGYTMVYGIAKMLNFAHGDVIMVGAYICFCMMTYLGMSLPMAVWSAVTWLKNPAAGNGSEVAIRRLEKRQALIVAGLSVLVTGAFYFILRWLRTPNLAFSTVSVTTGLLAAALTMLRSSYYALGCAANDLVPIVLWSLAAMKDPAYAPVVVNFAIFFLNDLYGFVSWRKRERLQTA